MALEQRSCVIQSGTTCQPAFLGGNAVNSGKPLPIAKQMVWKAYQQVKRNGKAAGVDGQSLEDFRLNLKNNLCKLWNRMASGRYFLPQVL